jgi:hypothetical protein
MEVTVANFKVFAQNFPVQASKFQSGLLRLVDSKPRLMAQQSGSVLSVCSFYDIISTAIVKQRAMKERGRDDI